MTQLELIGKQERAAKAPRITARQSPFNQGLACALLGFVALTTPAFSVPLHSLILAVIALAYLAALLWIGEDLRIAPGRVAPEAALFAAICVVVTLRTGIAQEALGSLREWLAQGVLFFLTLQCTRNAERRRWVLKAVCVLCAVYALLMLGGAANPILPLLAIVLSTSLVARTPRPSSRILYGLCGLAGAGAMLAPGLQFEFGLALVGAFLAFVLTITKRQGRMQGVILATLPVIVTGLAVFGGSLWPFLFRLEALSMAELGPVFGWLPPAALLVITLRASRHLWAAERGDPAVIAWISIVATIILGILAGVSLAPVSPGFLLTLLAALATAASLKGRPA